MHVKKARGGGRAYAADLPHQPCTKHGSETHQRFQCNLAMKNQQQQSYIPVAEPVPDQPQYNSMENGGWKQQKNQPYNQLMESQEYQSAYLAEAEKSVRLGFVRKVYGILVIQLLVTVGISSLFIVNEDCRRLALTQRILSGLRMASCLSRLSFLAAAARSAGNIRME